MIAGKPVSSTAASASSSDLTTALLRHVDADLAHRVLEQQAILGHLDGGNLRADELDVVLLEDAELVELHRQVERGLPAHRRQHGVGPLLVDDPLEHVGGQRLDVGAVGQLGVGHDRGRIAVDQHHLEPLALQRLERLRPGVVELAGLADDDRARPDHQHPMDVSTSWHRLPALHGSE